MKILLALLFFLISYGTLAQTTFGAEFTFTNAAINQAQSDGETVNNEESERHQDLMMEQVRRTCDGCRIIIEENKYEVEVYKVIYPDGWYFVIATDPAVVEVQTKPMTLADLKKQEQRIERDIFGAARAAGMAPSRSAGGGHIHFGYLSSTEGDLRLARNIIVDFANHPEMANGVLSEDTWNSTPISNLPEDRQKAFRQIIADVDSGKIKNIQELATQIQKRVYNWHRADWDPTEKYHALNLTRLANSEWSDAEKTFEIRSLEAQRNHIEFKLLTKLFEGRIEYLKTIKEPIPVTIPKQTGFFGGMSSSQKIDRFAKYVAESGVNFEDFKTNFDFGGLASAALAQKSYKAILLCRRVLSH
jgi:hypothetical protein